LGYAEGATRLPTVLKVEGMWEKGNEGTWGMKGKGKREPGDPGFTGVQGTAEYCVGEL